MSDLDEKHDIRDAEFFVNGTPWLQTGLFELGLQFHHETLGERNLAERIFQVIKRRTEPFYNNFSNPDPETVDTWLKALEDVLLPLESTHITAFSRTLNKTTSTSVSSEGHRHTPLLQVKH